jgi:hypothetical protein
VTSLTKTAVDLLLQAMETRAGKVQVATLKQVAPRTADKLLEAKLLVATGRIPVVAAMDGYEDEPMPAEWCAMRGQYGYHDSVGRWIHVEAREIAACIVDYPLAFAKMLVAFERAGPPRPTPLIDGLVWDVGTIRLTGAKSPVPVWFARRLAEPSVWQRVEALFARRPPAEVRITLTSAPGDRIPVTAHKRNIVMSVDDVLRAPGKLAISPQILGARVFPGQRQRRFPIDHSEDCGIVWLHDKEYRFRGQKHRHILSMLFDAYWAGRPVLRTSEVLQSGDHVHRDTKVTTLGRAFSGRSDWRDFIREADGNCWIDV